MPKKHDLFTLSQGTLAAELGPKDPDLLAPLRDDLFLWAETKGSELPDAWSDAIKEYRSEKYHERWEF